MISLVRLCVSGKDVRSRIPNIPALFFDQRRKLKIHLSIAARSWMGEFKAENSVET